MLSYRRIAPNAEDPYEEKHPLLQLKPFTICSHSLFKRSSLSFVLHLL